MVCGMVSQCGAFVWCVVCEWCVACVWCYDVLELFGASNKSGFDIFKISSQFRFFVIKFLNVYGFVCKYALVSLRTVFIIWIILIFSTYVSFVCLS